MIDRIINFFKEKYVYINIAVIYFLLMSMSLFLTTDYFPIIEICMLIVGAYVLVFCILKKFKPVIDFVKTPFFIWYVLFWGIVVIITFFRNNSQIINLLKTMVVFTAYIAGFGIMYIDSKTREKIKIVNMMEQITIFLCVWILIFDFPLLLQGERIGYSVMVGNPNSAGSLLSIYIFFITYKIIQSEKKHKLIHILVLLLCIGVILATGSKKAIIVAAISCVLFLFKDGHIILKRLIYASIVLTIVLTVSCTFLYDNVGRRFLSLFGELGLIEFQSDYSSKLRVEYINSAIKLWQKNIFLGGGYNNFSVNSGYNTYSHNNYTELLASVGIVGTIIYYGYYLYLLAMSIKCNNNMKCIMYILFIISTYISDVGAVTFYIYPLYYIMLLIIDFDTPRNAVWKRIGKVKLDGKQKIN